jgi:acetyl esterase/lipase
MGNLGRIVGGIYALGVILGGTLRFFPIFPPVRALWLLQLVVSELGLFLAVPLFFLAIWGAKGRPGFSIISCLASIALVLAVLPLGEAIGHERDWIWNLEYGPGQDQKPDPRIGSPYIGELSRPLFRFRDFFQLPVHPFALKTDFETSDGAKLPLYVYRSSAGKPGDPHPWVLSIHGGGWSEGDPRDLDQTIPSLLAAGYNVVAPSYRFAPTYVWPRQREDVETAYRFAIKNAVLFGLDPKRLWLFGRSAGGQIALKIAYSSTVVENVKGVIALYAPTDLDFGYRWALKDDVLDSRTLLKNFLGTTPELGGEQYHAASPLADVGPNSPPTLLLDGRSDPLVWYRHADRLTDALVAAKVRVVHLELPWATHGFDYFPNSLGGQIARNAILRFMENSSYLFPMRANLNGNVN